MTTQNRKYWSARKNKQLGPFDTYEQAVEAAYTLFPKKPQYRDCASVGYGEYGPHFDIRFVSPKKG